MSNPVYPTDVSALILVDVLDDFLSEHGKINPGIKDQIEKVNDIVIDHDVLTVDEFLAAVRKPGE
jgi:nicotinamidase-related amidase